MLVMKVSYFTPSNTWTFCTVHVPVCLMACYSIVWLCNVYYCVMNGVMPTLIVQHCAAAIVTGITGCVCVLQMLTAVYIESASWLINDRPSMLYDEALNTRTGVRLCAHWRLNTDTINSEVAANDNNNTRNAVLRHMGKH